jgi:hypothetical protein
LPFETAVTLKVKSANTEPDSTVARIRVVKYFMFGVD